MDHFIEQAMPLIEECFASNREPDRWMVGRFAYSDLIRKGSLEYRDISSVAPLTFLGIVVQRPDGSQPDRQVSLMSGDTEVGSFSV